MFCSGAFQSPVCPARKKQKDGDFTVSEEELSLCGCTFGKACCLVQSKFNITIKEPGLPKILKMSGYIMCTFVCC